MIVRTASSLLETSSCWTVRESLDKEHRSCVCYVCVGGTLHNLNLQGQIVDVTSEVPRVCFQHRQTNTDTLWLLWSLHSQWICSHLWSSEIKFNKAHLLCNYLIWKQVWGVFIYPASHPSTTQSSALHLLESYSFCRYFADKDHVGKTSELWTNHNYCINSTFTTTTPLSFSFFT